MARTRRTLKLIEMSPGSEEPLAPKARILAIEPLGTTGRKLVIVDTAPARDLTPPEVDAQITYSAASLLAQHPQIEFSDKVKRLAGYEVGGASDE